MTSHRMNPISFAIATLTVFTGLTVATTAHAQGFNRHGAQVQVQYTAPRVVQQQYAAQPQYVYTQPTQYRSVRTVARPRPGYYVNPALWLAFGVGDVLGDGTANTNYHFDAIGGPAIVSSRNGPVGFLLIPEFGYSLLSTQTCDENGESWSYAHYGVAGLAVGFQLNDYRDVSGVNLQLFGDALIGTNDNGYSIGVRTGLRGTILASVLGLEVSTQWTSDNEEEGDQIVRGMLMVDGVALAVALLAVSGADYIL